MLYIITGKINSYKTTRIKEHYTQTKCGDGFVSIKTMKDDKVLYYSLEQLSTKTKRIHIIHKEHYPNHFTNYLTLGPYVFDLAYLVYVEEYIDMLIKKDITPIYLDEIGMLEIQKQYFYKILKRLIECEKDVYITVREGFVEDVIDVFDVKNYQIIE